ncbi:hypothetical protein SERIO_v1c10220 [Spiroplasma eriocheiris]|uniref:Tyrosine specific protein phosphatases domain-containing protein n=2 Tax=Spiroplasma eriocheiris TaxID=315358 RepID=A0A0H3XI90_9MOLU|nr:hypothetical protein SPE_1026 [Spiroplasma eriocheiris CCTCC M 207170]AKM54578.1 hypothetical protein SERIO_v1c10220 [Spiroplasma eriocheiris]
MYRKITKNLYLGDYMSRNSDSLIDINAAEELDQSSELSQQKLFMNPIKTEENVQYFSFPFPDFIFTDQKINIQQIKEILKLLDYYINLKDENVYLHCVQGINRSASVAFMFCVINNIVDNNNFETAFNAFKTIYPEIEPTPGWELFLKKHFPYKNLVS